MQMKTAAMYPTAIRMPQIKDSLSLGVNVEELLYAAGGNMKW